MAAINSAINRLVSIPVSPASFKSEIQVFEQIARTNLISANIPRLIRRRQLRLLLAESRPAPPDTPEKKRWVRIPYLGSSSEKLASELRRYGYNTGFYPVTTIRSLLSTKDSTAPSDKPGVYRISCGECSATYIGQTGRRFRKRFSEHKTFHSNPDDNNAVALHCLEHNHDRNKLTGRLLHVCDKTTTMNRLEEAHILFANKTAGSMLLNDNSLFFHNNDFLNYFFDHSTNNLSHSFGSS